MPFFSPTRTPAISSLVEAKLYRKQRSNGATYLVATLTSTTKASVKEEWKLLLRP